MKDDKKQGLRCRFCEIVRGEVDAHWVWQSERWAAFLDARPLFVGHTLVVPTRHVPDLLELPDDLVLSFFVGCRAVARAVMRATEAGGIFFAVNNRVSQSIPHLHAHVVPRNKGDGLRGFFWPRIRYQGTEHARSIAERIRRELESELGDEKPSAAPA